jgi:enoyl-[acyl-carrier-protein] reductase (NADH)
MIDQNSLLVGKVGLVGGIANEHSIAAGYARALRAAGAEFAITYLKDKAKPFAEPVAPAAEPVRWHQSKCALAGPIKMRPQLDRAFRHAHR